VARNTAPALGLAAVAVQAEDPDAVLAALPADHHIGDEPAYQAVVAQALALAAATSAIVTVGIRPTGPETGFGYIEPGAAGPDGSRRVARFVEKPDRQAAADYVARGFLWNAGMFFFRAATLRAEIAAQLPELAAGLAEIARAPDAAARVYPTVPAISIDYGVMEHAAGILVVPGSFGWNDVGSWTALADTRAADAAGNVGGPLVALDATDNIVATDAGIVALVGVTGLVVVRAGDAVLVVPRARAQDVRDLVNRLDPEQR
jgi:mannose-1-phosphate guanylyltransferase